MSEEDKSRFVKIVGQYIGELNKIDTSNGTVYTLHDFDHHCCDLYSIISEILLADNAYGDYGLTDRELYILNLAVLLHDIGLKDYIYINRDQHAKISAKIIMERYNNELDCLNESVSNLSKNDIYALQAIVIAHSDDKSDKNGGCALNDKELTNSMTGHFGTIRAHFLANILRLADELDITTDRLGSLAVYNKLEEAKEKLTIEEIKNDKQSENYRNAEKSLEHWKRLMLFSELKIDESGTAHAIIDSRYINQNLERGGGLDEIIDKTKGIKKKIMSEFALFNNDVSKDVVNSNMIKMKRFVIDTDNSEIRKEIEEDSAVEESNKESGVNIISEEYEKKISDFITKRQLWDGGHFYRKDDLCARDWINIREITNTNGFFKKFEMLIITSIDEMLELKRANRRDVAIIGVDFSGILIGSKVGLALGIPFIYAKNEDKSIPNSGRKLTVDLGENIEHVIILTDVIVTYHTINALLEKYNLKDRLLAIYGILYREPIVRGDVEKNLIKGDYTALEKKTYVFNKDYGIELHCSKDCPIKKKYNRCIADNLPAGV
jgi:adenine/guanine phosphoribosyltransferase-like PRPP-binding protein